ncbi:deoxycytidyl transferase [Aspergillus nanangensis]|uniref:DNA repair protein REV1 n=1 Tax=Aspergillus nanangensis TaxID=2582783 RepID=A0AAD4CMP0_ASPNN|nr:deoxycytidyl transferase [Aspergillus nanangensis]
MGSRLDEKSSAVRKRIESHTFDTEAGEEYDSSAFGGFGDYFRRKKIKLQNLDSEIRSSATDCPPIFRGVVTHVNGYTQPSLQDLHHMIVSHGGGFLQYLDGKTAATHIIASSLTPKKREEFRRYRIVKPAWVVESIKAGRLLPWDLFRVVDEGQSQKILRFDNGRVLSHPNSPQAGYKGQTASSWYTSQLIEPTNSNTSPSPASMSRNVPHHPSTDTLVDQSQSDYGDFPSFTSVEEPNPAPTFRPPQTPQELDGAAPGGSMSPGLMEHDKTHNISPNHAAGAARVSTPPGHDSITVRPDMTPEEYNAQLLSDPRMRKSSVVNPEFLQQFYRESRLHHLSTWKAELKAQLQSRTREKSQSQIGRRKPVPGARRYIMHVDFDCFFAAVSTLKHPELEGKPVAIAHGTGNGSEIASCNYAARAHGVKNGMWMKSALQASPDLKVLPYDFPAYEDASQKFYSAILSVDGAVQSVSIDEALLDITAQCLEVGGTDGRGVSEGSIYREQAKADEIAQHLRESVKGRTGCAVSVGIGGNILQAKVALRKAKPAGQFQLKPDAVIEFIGNLSVRDLPGVGYSLGTKMEELSVKLVKDIREVSREKLISTLGPKTGIKLWDYARGVDRTEVGNEVLRKSVSAEVNWGIRFINQDQAEEFVKSLCEELHRRLVENLVKGKQLTLKVMRRSADAPLEPVKHLGHGKCDTFNKSCLLGVATNAEDLLAKEAISMLRSFGITPGDLRGLGVQMTKLEPLKPGSGGKFDSSQQQLKFKASPIRRSLEKPTDPDDLESPRKGDTETVIHGPSLADGSQKPLNISGTQFIMPSQTDPKVVAELPNDIRSRLISQSKSRQDSRSVSPCPPSRNTELSVSAKLPPQSQLDPEALAALPDDVRAEVMGYYDKSSRVNDASQPTPCVSTPLPASSGPLVFKKPTTPPKKRRGRPSTISSAGNTTFTQTNFLFPKSTAAPTTIPHPRSRQLTPPTQAPEVSAEFLAELPEDIRQEVLEEQKRMRMLQRITTRPPAPGKTADNKSSTPALPPQPEEQLRLSPRPERPTFTSRKLSSVPDLRDAIGSWHAAFANDCPFSDDVESLSQYLERVIVEEKDIDKAVSLIGWLTWLVVDGKATDPASNAHISPKFPSGSSKGSVTWDEALWSLRARINGGLATRGLPPVDFS